MSKLVITILSLLFFMNADFVFIPKIYDFWVNNPDKEIYIIAGGRSKGATWGIADKLIVDSMQDEHFICCSREIKGTVDHSSRRTIEQRIKAHGLKDFFIFQNTQTICKKTGSLFTYTGLSKITEDNVQGTEGLTRFWIGEAHTMELTTFQKLEPTLRDNRAKLYIDYNTQFAHTPIHAMFTENPNSYPFIGKKDMPELAYLFTDYRDNIKCPEKILRMAERNRKQYSVADWNWIWLGKLKDASERFLCNYNDIDIAMNRYIPYESVANETRIVGCDIAHMGGDKIVFKQRRGNKFLDPGYKSSMQKTPKTCDDLEAYIQFDKGAIIVMDNGHVGAAVADMMELRGYYVERVDFGGTDMHFDAEHCKDCATDMAFNFVDKLPHIELSKDDKAALQISQRKWDFINNHGVRKIESKKDFKEHAVNLEGNKSPDEGDATWLALYNKNKYRVPENVGNVIKVWSRR